MTSPGCTTARREWREEDGGRKPIASRIWPLLLLAGVAMAQPSLQITSPANGTVVSPGGSVTVSVTAAGSFQEVFLVGTGGLWADGLSAPPYQFTVSVPLTSTPGPYTLTAVGYETAGTPIYSSPVTIDIERPDTPDGIYAEPGDLSGVLRVGEEIALRVIGHYADGTSSDLTRSTRTTYVSQDQNVARVSADGLVTITGGGTTQIVINGSLYITVTVVPPIAVVPTTVALKASQRAKFLAKAAEPTDQTVVWSLSPSIGSVDALGVYTAPDVLSGSQVVTLTAASAVDLTKNASATITLSSETSISVTPEWATLYAGQQQRFSATLTNAGTQGINWSITPATLGSIDSSGLYTAPTAITGLQSVTVTATSVSTPSISGSRTFYLSAQPFELLAPKPSLFVAQGGSNEIDITELATDGFPHPVSFSVSGLPAGVTGSFNNPTLTGVGRTTLTVAAALSASSGSYQVTVTGTDTVYAALSKTVSFTLVVGSGFTLSVSSPTLTTIPGGSVGVLVTETAINGFDSPVLLSAGSSDGVTTKFPETQLSGRLLQHPGSVGLLLTAPIEMQPGTYTINITGTIQATGSRATTTLTLVVATPVGPNVVSMFPNPGTQTTQVFDFQLVDPNGVGTVNSLGVLVGGTPSTANSCYVSYSPVSQTVSLRDDADTGWVGTVPLGTFGSLRNSRCILDTGATKASVSAGALSFSLVLTPVSPTNGAENVYVAATDTLMSSNWRQIGVWTISANSLPVNWRDQDVGVLGHLGPGGSTYTPDTGSFRSFGIGNNVDTPPDAFHFTYQPMTGDGTIIARLTDIDNVSPTTSAGVMVRATADPVSAYVYLGLQSPGGGCQVSARAATAAAPSTLACTGAQGVPIWLKLVRSGSTFSTQTSVDGLTWTDAAGPVSASMPANALVGMSVTSGTPNAATFASFDSVSLTVPQVAASPTFSPTGGTYSAPIVVTISTTTPGAQIRFTTDGTTPTESHGTLLNGPLTVSSAATIKAVAYGAGLTASGVGEAAYTLVADPPVFSPTPGTYSTAQSVTLTANQDSFSIRYTTDGSAPTETIGTLYSGPITVSADTTIKAVAYGTGVGLSTVASGSYDIDPISPPLFSEPQANYNTPRTITITSATPGVTIRYTMDGSVPTASSGTIYSTPVVIDATTTLKAVAIGTGGATSTVTSVLYTMTVGNVVFNPPSSAAFYVPTSISFSSVTPGATIRYTADGTTPSPTVGTECTGTCTYTIDVNKVVKAMAYKAGWSNSGVSSPSYTMMAKTPAFSPSGGTYFGPTSITISTITPNTQIRYTTDGTTPTSTVGTTYTGPVLVSTTQTLKAIAYGTGMTSAVAGSSVYNMKAAAPAFDVPSGTYQVVKTVTITSTTPGVSFRYTTDGSTPSQTNGTVYSEPVTISMTQSLKAIAYAPGMSDSVVTAANYTIQAPAPTFTPPAGSYYGVQTVAINNTMAGVSIRYTVNGNTPTPTNGTLYTDPVTISATSTLRAVAYGTNIATSAVTMGTYTVGSGPAWYNNGWAFRKAITIDRTKVAGGAALTDFPMLFLTTDPNLRTVANGGSMGKIDGTDLLFTSSDGITKLSHELENYDAATGDVVAWVKIPSLSVSANTVIYAYYGNAVAADQQDKMAVWDSNFKGVWHLRNTGSLDMTDSTSNLNHGSGLNSPQTQSGVMAGAASFSSASQQTITTSNVINTNASTVSAWVKVSNYSEFGRIFGFANGNDGSPHDKELLFDSAGVPQFYTWDAGAARYSIGTAAMPVGQWTYLVGVNDGASNMIYVNGSLAGSTAAGVSQTGYTVPSVMVGGTNSNFSYATFLIDEARISTSARSAGWIGTEFNNQSTPSTFLTIGTAQSR